MADHRIREEIITEFLLNTCQFRRWMNENDVYDMFCCSAMTLKAVNDIGLGCDVIPLITGSAAEFYIEPVLSCVGDVDLMYHRSHQLAIPAGYSPPTQLPGEFGSRVMVCEIVNTEFPGYVYLVSSYLLTECIDDDKYKAVPCEREIVAFAYDNASVARDSVHGPALFKVLQCTTWTWAVYDTPTPHLVKSRRSSDSVFCMRCLIWPSQAADWPTRHRNYGWPDSATVGRVVSHGCDVVQVAHHLCRQDEWIRKRQFRLSFSRAEIVLLNSWMPVQQIVYHMLRYFMKNEILTDSANNTGGGTLSNYHIKTLMLWACELKSRSWWTDDLNIVRICVELLHTLAVWLTDTRCKHYFINNCNLFDRLQNSRYIQVTVNRLMSITRSWFCEWYTDNYVHKCVLQLCPSSVRSKWVPHSSTLHDVVYLQNAVSVVVKRRRVLLPLMTSCDFCQAQFYIVHFVSRKSLTLRSCLCWVDQLAKSDRVVCLYFTAVVFLHVAHKTTQSSLTDEMLDVLAATCLQSNDVRRCLNARHSSELSLSLAAMLMKVVANNSRSTVQLIEIELSKAYLHRALRCKDSDSNSINCLANVYLAVLYYTTEQYQTAIDHCTLVTRSQDHSQCSSRVVQGELLLSIDDQIDRVLGLAVFYQYVRAAALNEEQGRRHVSVFTTELFAYYLHIQFLPVTECRQLSQTSLTDEIQQYRNCLCNSPDVFVTDVMVFNFANCAKYPSKDRLLMADKNDAKSLILHQLDTSKLVELLQQSAVEHLTSCRELHTSHFNSAMTAVLPDYLALYAYKRGHYQHCLQLSMHSARKLIVGIGHVVSLPIWLYPELIQLLDDDIASLIGLMTLAKRLRSHSPVPLKISWLSLSLYLMTQCQIKLRHPMTSLIATLNYVHIAGGKTTKGKKATQIYSSVVLKFVEQKILKYL